ncbi:DUF397 domain-containing protein [Streptomyces specialis]|uniref:DUF397 domain-containing protein n=1 Tax=Streptomyces specialis TaxID=498367 RepID=UPI00073F03F2
MRAAAGDWFKSSFSASQKECAEVRFAPGVAYVRDTVHRNGAVMKVVHAGWGAFLLGTRKGDISAPL